MFVINGENNHREILLGYLETWTKLGHYHTKRLVWSTASRHTMDTAKFSRIETRLQAKNISVQHLPLLSCRR